MKYLYLCGAMLGCAAATKWTALYFYGLYGIDLIFYLLRARKNKTSFPIHHMAMVFFIIPAVIYIATYAQFFILGGEFNRFISIQQQMWWYHSGLKATHSYQSVPWQWLLNWRPVWIHTANTKDTLANIYNLGNSIILYGGLIAVALTIIKEKMNSWAKWFTLLGYFILWVPWCFSPRIMLFYHYMPALPFLCILLARKLLQFNFKFTVGFSVVATMWFLLFYPHATGIAVPRSFEAIYFALPAWR